MDNHPGYIPDELPSSRQDRSVQCTPQQLRDAGYVRPPPVPSKYLRDAKGILIDHDPETRNGIARPVDRIGNIQICCLEPPPVPWAASLTIKEKYLERPPLQPPLEGKQIIYPPPTLPPLILRERPPPRPDPPTHHETCIVDLPLPPLPRTVITHICKIPPKPRDIIIERWLPYKLVPSKNFIVKRVGPPPPEPELHNINIIYEPQVNIKHQIHEHGPIPTNPETYVQQFGDQLLSVKDLYDQLFAELEKQRADDNTRQRLQHMCRGPLDSNPGPCNNGVYSNIQRMDDTVPPGYDINNILNKNPCDDIFGITAY